MLIELNQKVAPRLYICDGIVAMEGNGPTSGDPVSMGVLLMSTDPIALDTVFCHLVNLDPSYVPTNLYGETLGLGTWHDDRIEIVTADGTISEKELKRSTEIQTSTSTAAKPAKKEPSTCSRSSGSSRAAPIS